MDVGAVGGWSWYGDGFGDSSEVYEGVCAVGFIGDGKEKAREKEIVTVAARPDTFPELALTRRRVRARGKDSKGSATSAGSRVIPQGNAPRREASQKEKETVTKERVAGVGKRAFGRWTEKTTKETKSGSSRRSRSQEASGR